MGGWLECLHLVRCNNHKRYSVEKFHDFSADIVETWNRNGKHGTVDVKNKMVLWLNSPDLLKSFLH